jgi:transcriptional regulator with XRE-family HTH domain
MTSTMAETTKAVRNELDDAAIAIAARLKREREARNWSLADLSLRAGVSKGMISKIERNEASPTATVLGRLSGAFGLPLSVLLALAERADERLSLRDKQPVWSDPQSGYTRRAISPPNGGTLELLDVSLPAGVRVPYPASAFAFQQQQIWVTGGRLEFREGTSLHVLNQGDCLQLGAPADCEFYNPGPDTVAYVIALARR